MVECAFNPSYEWGGGGRKVAGQDLAHMLSSKIPRDPVSNNQGVWLLTSEVDFWSPHAFTHICIHTHLNMHAQQGMAAFGC